jgi:hypothetical protein
MGRRGSRGRTINPVPVSWREQPGRGDVYAQLGQGPGFSASLQGTGGGGGTVPDPGGLVRLIRDKYVQTGFSASRGRAAGHTASHASQR